jgi:transcriptional regulator with XRE-family HTH domain
MATQETGGSSRGSADADFQAAIGKALRRAISGMGHGAQSELARRTGITQPEISRLARGLRPTPLNLWEMREIERAAGRPHGYILREMGYLSPVDDARVAIATSPDLDEQARRAVLATYDAMVGAHATTRNNDDTPKKPARR